MSEFRQARWSKDEEVLEPLVFEKSSEGKKGYSFTDEQVDEELDFPKSLEREEPPNLPSLSETEVVRHYTRLSEMNYGVDSGIYPLGSCTMKYNPKISEEIASLDTASCLHPEQSEKDVQGALEIMHEMENLLKKVSGMDRVTFQPSAGAHGEFLAMLLVKAYHEANNEEDQRNEVIVPDSAHGTNPASAAMAGYEVIETPSNSRGRVDMEALKSIVSENTAALMLTNPNTLGYFEDEIEEIVDLIHEAGGLLFYDGANLNGIIGKVRPGDMGFDIVHFNLHKTFASPHGGGGPGAGPIGVKEKLEDLLPDSLIGYDEEEDMYHLIDNEEGIGKIQAFHGNFAVILKAYAYVLMMGASGLEEVSESAVLNTNYLRENLSKIEGYELGYRSETPSKHETVFSTEPLKTKQDITARDVSKRLLDYGIHAPTTYFPPIVPEALMIEPTETVSRRELDRLLKAFEKIAKEAREDPKVLKNAPKHTSITRLDETKASRNPILSWKMYQEKRLNSENSEAE